MLKLVRALDMPFNNVLEYYNSFKNKFEVNSFTISTIADGKDAYYERIIDSFEELYYLVDEEKPDYIIGFGSIENSGFIDYHKDNENDGNISYGVRENKRNKGYGTLILNLLLLECERLGMEEVCISCLEDNLASKRVIENNFGVLEKYWLDDYTEKLALKYWIKLHPTLEAKLQRIKRINQTKISYIQTSTYLR